jgi:hypothetical protein
MRGSPHDDCPYNKAPEISKVLHGLKKITIKHHDSPGHHRMGTNRTGGLMVYLMVLSSINNNFIVVL